jgi:hypothetical protein
MSEQFPTHEPKAGYAEQLAELERQTAGEEVREISEHASGAELSPDKQAEQLSEVRTEVATIAETAPSPVNVVEQPSTAPAPSFISNELRSVTAARALVSIRSRLPATDKALSKLVHQPVVRTLSNAGSRSVARPSALLTGGFLAFVGTSLYLYLASHIGFTYNYAVASLLFVGGFIIGFAAEALVALISRAKR